MVQAADTVDSVWVKVARDQETMGWVREGNYSRKWFRLIRFHSLFTCSAVPIR